MSFDDETHVIPDGLQIRGLRHDRGWSRRALVAAISEATFRESGLRETISRNVLEGVEEANEPVPYSVLCLIAAGLDRNPVELVLA